jgi:hypothetical protein
MAYDADSDASELYAGKALICENCTSLDCSLSHIMEQKW